MNGSWQIIPKENENEGPRSPSEAAGVVTVEAE
jgi:hypothetical protein